MEKQLLNFKTFLLVCLMALLGGGEFLGAIFDFC